MATMVCTHFYRVRRRSYTPERNIYPRIVHQIVPYRLEVRKQNGEEFPPNSLQPLSIEEEEILWQRGLSGKSNPQALAIRYHGCNE